MFILDDKIKQEELIAMLLSLGFDFHALIKEAKEKGDNETRLKYILLNECIDEILKELEKCLK